MAGHIYLLNIAVSGIKNIKKSVRLDFYKKTVDKHFDPEKYRVKAIYGENGVGKSALITAVNIFKELFIGNNYLNQSQNQILLNELINKETGQFVFQCEYLLNLSNDIYVYKYEVHIKKNENNQYEIIYEKFMQKSGNYSNDNYKVIFEVNKGELVYANICDEIKSEIEKSTLNLLKMRVLADLYLDKVLDSTFRDKVKEHDNFFTVHIFTLLMMTAALDIYISEEDQHELYLLSKKIKESGVDLGQSNDVNDIDNYLSVNEKKISKKHFPVYEEKVKQLTQFIKIFKTELINIDIDKKEDGEDYICELVLKYDTYSVNKEFESTGIKKLIRLYDCFYKIQKGGIVFIDEMDSNLNDVYLCKLIEYFMYYGKGQLCFTTHNLDPMTILKENKYSIDFLSSDNKIIQWTLRGNSSPDNCYKKGMIKDLPFNIDATDFLGIFGE